jgi:MFS family permease
MPIKKYIPKRLKFLLRSLRSRNYRLFFMGQGISLIGTWMQMVALGWLVYRLTGSAFLLGLVGFASQIPAFLLTPFAGVWVDRLNRHRILITTQTCALLQATALSILVLTDVVQVWQVMVLGVFLGIINAFDMPARQAFVVEMVEKKEDLSNAIALNSSLFNGARLIGPTVAGVLIAAFGEGICFLLNAVSYLAVIVALLMMHHIHKPREGRPKRIFAELKEGFRYAFSFPPIRSIILLIGVISMLGMGYAVLMPIFASEILQGGPRTLGFLMGATGVGAMLGALYMASRKSVVGLERVIGLASIIFGVALVAFSLSPLLWLSLVILFLLGFGMMSQMASCNTLLQTVVDDDKRGRVMSLYGTAFMGLAPFGSLLVGSIANWIGAPYALLLSGAVCTVSALLFVRQTPRMTQYIQPIYVKLGIMNQPETKVEEKQRG